MDGHKLVGITLLACLLMGIGLVAALGTNQVVISAPANPVWSNLSQFSTTSNFSFYWTDPDAAAGMLANCSLYMNTSSTGLVADGNRQSYNASSIKGNTTTLNANSFWDTNTTYYWTVKCYNSSLTPTSWYPDAMSIYMDNDTIPQWQVVSYSFTNNTNSTTASHWFYINFTDAGNAHGSTSTVEILNASSIVMCSGSTTALTPVNITCTLPQGSHKLRVRVTDPALNSNTSTNTYDVKVATTAVVVTFISATPANASAQAGTTLAVNFTVTSYDGQISTITMQEQGTSRVITTGNCSAVAASRYCTYSWTGLSNGRYQIFNVTVNDTTGNSGFSGNRYFSIETGTPSVSTKYNMTLTQGTPFITMTSRVPTSCTVNLYGVDGAFIKTITGTLGTVGATTTNCTYAVAGTDLSADGPFTLEYNVTDDLGVSATGNLSGIRDTLSAGWNLITYVGVHSKNTSEICTALPYCTQVAWYNNSYGSKAFTTYSKSTPNVNNGTGVTAGNSVFIYVNTTSYFLQDDYTPAQGVAASNISLYADATNGWNSMFLLYNTTMYTVLQAKSYNGTYPSNCAGANVSLCNITIASWYNASSGKYYTCSRSLDICGGTSLTTAQIVLPKGSAVWVLADYNVTLNVSRING